jgi:predicted RNase H-like HicB family nuclease
MTTGSLSFGEIFTRANAHEVLVEPKPTAPPVSLVAALHVYIDKALGHAQYEYLSDDQQYYGEIPGFAGVYASADTKEACAAELHEVLIEWIALRLEDGRALPAAVPSR